MFTVPSDNCSERGSPEAKAGGRGRGEGEVVVVVVVFHSKKVIGVLEGLRGLPACVLRSPAPSSAARDKGLSLQLSGRPRPRATRPASASRHPGGRKGRCPPGHTGRTEQLPQPSSPPPQRLVDPLTFLLARNKERVGVSQAPLLVELRRLRLGLTFVLVPDGHSAAQTPFLPAHLYTVLPVAWAVIQAGTMMAIL